MKKTIYPKTERIKSVNEEIIVTEELDGSNLCNRSQRVIMLLNTNVDYSVKSATRNIWIDDLQIYVSNLLEAGNSKLSKDILIFDLLAGETCWNSKQCINSCYAIKSQKRFPNVYNKRFINTYLAKNNLPFLKNTINNQLKHTNKPYIRIHSSGDFYSQDYVNMWTDIISNNTNKKFYFYSKVTEIFDFSTMLENTNVNMVNSILPNGSINYGTHEYVEELSRYYNIPICPYTLGNNNIICGEDCLLCMKSNYMLFVQH